MVNRWLSRAASSIAFETRSGVTVVPTRFHTACWWSGRTGSKSFSVIPETASSSRYSVAFRPTTPSVPIERHVCR